MLKSGSGGGLALFICSPHLIEKTEEKERCRTGRSTLSKLRKFMKVEAARFICFLRVHARCPVSNSYNFLGFYSLPTF